MTKMTPASLAERITRSLAYMLRHRPDEFDLELDRHGFADLDEVVRALNERLDEPVEEDDLLAAIDSGDHPRYEVANGRIRALYGHSIDVDPGKPTRPPEFLYLGVGSRDADRARRHGLRGGRRRFLHLSRTVDDAIETGRRIAREYAVIRVRALEAWEEGVNFYDRGALFLADSIPTEFLEVGEVRDDGAPKSADQEERGSRRRPDRRRRERDEDSPGARRPRRSRGVRGDRRGPDAVDPAAQTGDEDPLRQGARSGGSRSSAPVQEQESRRSSQGWDDPGPGGAQVDQQDRRGRSGATLDEPTGGRRRRRRPRRGGSVLEDRASEGRGETGGRAEDRRDRHATRPPRDPSRGMDETAQEDLHARREGNGPAEHFRGERPSTIEPARPGVEPWPAPDRSARERSGKVSPTLASPTAVEDRSPVGGADDVADTFGLGVFEDDSEERAEQKVENVACEREPSAVPSDDERTSRRSTKADGSVNRPAIEETTGAVDRGSPPEANGGEVPNSIEPARDSEAKSEDEGPAFGAGVL